VNFNELSSGDVSASFQNNLSDSIFSNGINYGNISAITQNIHIYSTNNGSSSQAIFYGSSTRGSSITHSTTTGTQQRPGIYGSAGGVIAYGLNVMRRMINHGQVSSSDVAGGIVGATYVATGQSSGTVIVDIDTALNYGSVRAFNRNFFNNIDTIMTYETITQNFYDVNDPFIFPVSPRNNILYPESKRGIGGIFGRLQRGLNQSMSAVGGNFDFIVNLDPNVDLIGRLDQVYNWSSSHRFFIFGDSIYYSARENDTTQAVFTGFYFYFGSTTATRPQQITRTEETYNQERYRYFISGSTFNRVTQRSGVRETNVYYSGQRYRSIGGTIFPFEIAETKVRSTFLNNVDWFDVPETTITISSNDYPGTGVTASWDIPEIVQVFSQSTSTLSSRVYYYATTIPVPYITENPNNIRAEFVYDENFTMRDDTTLTSQGVPITSYIYYIENEILGNRFQTERPFGMYVLSTSSGSSFGSVIPANLRLENLYPLDGLLPFDIDYETISNRIPLSNFIIESYIDLRQTKYNDKSQLLEEEQVFSLSENDGSKTNLLNPTIDYNNRIITFDLSLSSIAVGQTSVSYLVSEALLPKNAIIAARLEDYFDGSPIDIEFFRSLLETDEGLDISELAPAVLDLDLTPYLNISSNTNVQLGFIRSYAEATKYLSQFVDNPNYFTDYEIRLNLKPREDPLTSPAPFRYFIDGDTTGTLFDSSLQIIPGLIQESLRLTFRDTAFILSPGSNIEDFISLEYENEVVSKDDYTIIIEPASGSFNQFGFTIQLSEQMRAGTYTINYKYFFADIERNIDFQLAPSSDSSVLELSYYSSGIVQPSGTTFSSFVNFGYEFDLSDISFVKNINNDPLIPSYFDIDSFEVSYLDSIELAPFAELLNVNFNGITYNNGYRTYQFTYQIQAESGTITTYTHNIIERPISIVNVFKNSNRVNINNLFATREANLTSFAIDFNIDRNLAEELYNVFDENELSYFSINVTGIDFDSNPIAPQNIVGLEFSGDIYLNILMSNLTEPGVYTFSFTYTRGNEIITLPDSIQITKNQGVNAYLSNIAFSETATETDYPLIFESDVNGVVIPSSFVMAVFFAGIDYNDSEFSVFNFRIDGQVANTPLNEYIPFFLDFLPVGATISRKIYPIEDPLNDWTEEVDNESTPALKSRLATDFTLLPDTLQEPDENEDVIITYRVTSEDGNTIVFYHITVVDVIFNVSLIFEVIYDHPTLGLLDAQDSELLGVPIMINVRNFNTNLEVTNIIRPTPEDFPIFNDITSFNNSVFMFFVANNNDYRYRFGRNISGFFAFEVTLPKDPNGNDYAYTILFNGAPLDDIEDFVATESGKYFYINGGTKNRTRRFSIVVTRTNESVDDSWGLDDYDDTWR
jgi:hypothetical protein